MPEGTTLVIGIQLQPSREQGRKFTHFHKDTHTQRHTHAHTQEHWLRRAYLLLSSSRARLGGASSGDEGQTLVFSPPAGSPVFSCLDATVIFRRSELPWSTYLPLLKVKSSHETKLKALEQSMKTSAVHGALRFLELK